MKKSMTVMLLAALLLLSLSGCQEEPESMEVGTTELAAVQVTEAAVETLEPTAESTEAAAPALLERPESGKVCVGFMPTEAGAWRYVVLPDQAAAVAAYEKAVNSIYSDEWWIKGDRTRGLMVVYGEIWDFVESGELVYALGRVKAEDAADLYALCAAAAAEAGWKTPVSPDQLTEIHSATLRQGETEITLTDTEKLTQLEAMLTAGKYALGGTSCPFTVRLDVERESGQRHTVALATDSCGVWMSEGYYYDYGNDSQPLFDLFEVQLDAGKLTMN